MNNIISVPASGACIHQHNAVCTQQLVSCTFVHEGFWFCVFHLILSRGQKHRTHTWLKPFPCPTYQAVALRTQTDLQTVICSLLRHQTDVHAGLASLDLVQAQQRWASIQSSTALIYQNQNQPDAVGLIRLIFHQLTSCQMLCLLSDCQMTSKYLQTNQSEIARCSSMIELRWNPTASIRPTWTTSCHLLSFYTFSESRTCNRRMKSGRWLYYLVTNPSVLWTRGFVSAAEAFSLLLKDLITFIKKKKKKVFRDISSLSVP